jgi:predicted kinase
LQVPWSIVSCRAPVDVLRNRVAKRLERKKDPSDATLDVLEAQLKTDEPLTVKELERATVIDTSIN